MTSSSAPWRNLPPRLADLLEPELPEVAREAIQVIGAEVPEYARPLEGAFGRAVQRGVSEALQRFIALIRDPAAPPAAAREVYVALGRGEFTAGRTIDALQSAYRVGARVAWRQFARAAHAGGLGHEDVAHLAEAIFAYIDELSAESVEGYARAQSERAGERERQRRRLVRALLDGSDEAVWGPAARACGWRAPQRVAALICPEDALSLVVRQLDAGALAGPAGGTGCVVVGDPDGPGRRRLLSRAAAAGGQAVLGPTGSLADLPSSWRLARRTLELVDGPGLHLADEHLERLLLAEAAPVVERIAALRLGCLRGLTPKSRQRMLQTALAYLRHQGNAVAAAAELGIHPQTARYRISRLREVMGGQLDDPAARFELEVALRAGGPAVGGDVGART